MYLCRPKYINVMENRRFDEKHEPEIVFSKSVKAGKRIYYLDVKKARNEDLYLCITESKKKQVGEAEVPQFEKHKIFLYKEDFVHFMEALNESVDFVKQNVGEISEREEWVRPEDGEEHVAQAADDSASDEPKKRSGLFGRMFNK